MKQLAKIDFGVANAFSQATEASRNATVSAAPVTAAQSECWKSEPLRPIFQTKPRSAVCGFAVPCPAAAKNFASKRSEIARERALLARAALAECRLCAYDCGVNRLAGPAGRCHAGSQPRVFSAQVEVSDELELIPTFALAFSGCDLRCDFCITGGPSWNPRAGEAFHAQRLAAKIQNALDDGARTVMFLGGEPTIHLPSVLELVAELPDSATLIWKTNAHGSAQSRELLDGIFDIWLADYKFGNDACAERLARVTHYAAVVQENLLWAAQHSKLIIRHLLMPGHIDCCWRPVAEWIAAHLPGVKVNLRSGFWPAWHAARHAELRGTVATADAERAHGIARELKLNLIQ